MSGGDRCDGDGLINPALFPVKSAEFCESEIVEAASGLRAMGVGTLSEVLDVKAEWSKLPGCYEAPEQGLVYALMDPAVVSAEELKSVLGRAADRLDVYAVALKGVQARLSSLEARAVAFRNRVKDGVWVDRSEARGASVRDLFWGAVDWVPGIDEDKVKVYWKEDSGAVEENNALLEEFSGILADVSAAAAECANGINGLLTRVSPGKVEALPAEAFHNPAQPMPWGRPATEQRNCPESVGHGVYEFGKSTLEGAGQLLLGYNPRTGGFFEVESYGQAWGGLANLAVSVAVVVVPGTDLYAAAGLPGSEWIKERQKVVRETLLSFVSYDPSRPDDPWHKWKEDPVAAFTEGALNVGTCFIPAGQVAGVLKAGSAGARVAKFAAGVAEMVVPAGSWLVKGGVHAIPVLRSVLGKVDDVVGAVAQRPVVSLKSSVLGVALRAVDVAGVVPVSKPVSAALFDGGAGGSRSAGVGVSGSRSVGSGVLDPVSRVSGGSRPGGAGLGQGMAVVGRADRVPGVGSWVDGVDGRPGPDGVRPSSEAGGGSGASSRAESQDGAGTRLESETNPHPEVHDGTSTCPDNIDTHSVTDRRSGSEGALDSGHASKGDSTHAPTDPAKAGRGAVGETVGVPDGTVPLNPGKGKVYDPDAPVRETVSALDAPRKYTPEDVQRALDNAPVDKLGRPLDHRTGVPLDLTKADGSRGWEMRWSEANGGEWVAERFGNGHPTGLAPKGDNGAFGYDDAGNLMPYANHRPTYSMDDAIKVWKQMDPPPEPVLDAHGNQVLGPHGKPLERVRVLDKHDNRVWIEWEVGTPRKGIWDIGHPPGGEYWKLRRDYLSHKFRPADAESLPVEKVRQMETDAFLERFRMLDELVVEEIGRNRSRLFEEVEGW